MRVLASILKDVEMMDTVENKERCIFKLREKEDRIPYLYINRM
jgi:hypothetical protein